jgi:two-component system LytT family response regulator
MIKAVIIDDERNSIETLLWKVENFTPDVKVIATFTDPQKGMEYLQKNEIDVLFLDIQMPNLSGFDVLEALDEIDFEVIFTTAFDQYGIQAVKFSALDYLLKPVRNKELEEAIDRYINKRQARNPKLQIDNLLQNLKSESSTGLPARITLATKESLELVEPAEICYCESDSNYTMIYLVDGRKKLISRTLREFEDMLKPFNFIRTHNSFLVNMAEVREYVKTDGGYIVMKNNANIPVSKSKREGLMAHF